MVKGAPNIVKRRESNKKKRNERDEDSSDGDEMVGVDLPNSKKQKKLDQQQHQNQGKAHPKQISRIHVRGSIKFKKIVFKKNFWTGALPENPPSEALKAVRKSLNVNVKGALQRCPPPIETLQCIGLPPSFKLVFDRLRYPSPTAIQKQAWPAILGGSNVLGIAPTGSGKTLAFGLPMIPHILDQGDHTKNKMTPSPTCVVLVPTRELAVQVTQTLKPLFSLFKIRSLAVYGGVDRHTQVEQLATSALHILVATPGRLLDLNSSGEVSLEDVTYLVIDEADRMLALGFEEQLNAISQFVRPERQTLLFSATFPGKLRDVCSKWLTTTNENVSNNDETEKAVDDFIIIRVNTLEFTNVKETPSEKKREAAVANKVEEDNQVKDAVDQRRPAQKQLAPEVESTTVNSNVPSSDSANSANSEKDDFTPNKEEAEVEVDSSTHRKVLSLTVARSITQHIHVCAAHKKPRLMINYITRIREKEKKENVRQVGSMLIFCTKIKTLQYLAQFLQKNGITVSALHGQLLQKQREQILADFKAGKINILCCTDVASRGIHIKRLKYVVNYDFPGSLELYCHRVGRTGRQDAAGDAYSFLTRNMAPLAEDLISLLESCGQVIEPNLVALKDDYIGGSFVFGEEDAAGGNGGESDGVSEGEENEVE